VPMGPACVKPGSRASCVDRANSASSHTAQARNNPAARRRKAEDVKPVPGVT